MANNNKQQKKKKTKLCSIKIVQPASLKIKIRKTVWKTTEIVYYSPNVYEPIVNHILIRKIYEYNDINADISTIYVFVRLGYLFVCLFVASRILLQQQQCLIEFLTENYEFLITILFF